MLHSEYDIDHSDYIELTEFTLLLDHRKAEIQTRILNLSGELIMVVAPNNENSSNSVNKSDSVDQFENNRKLSIRKSSKSKDRSVVFSMCERYLPPAMGTLNMKIYDAVGLKEQYKVMTAIEKEYIFEVGKESGGLHTRHKSCIVAVTNKGQII